MIPDTLLGLLLFAGSIGPGYVWVRVAEQRRPREQRSAILEAGELAFVGILTTSISALLVFALADAWTAPGVDTAVLINSGTSYIAEEPTRGIGTLITILVLSYGLAYIAARIRHKGAASIRPGLRTWDALFNIEDPETTVHATAELRDGRRFSGWIFAWDVGGAEDAKSLALHAPIRVREPGGQPQTLDGADFLTLSQADIVWMSANWFPRPGGLP